MLTPDDLLELARRCVGKIDLPATQRRRVPSFSEIEGQCEHDYESLLEALLDDEVFAPVDVAHQEALATAITQALSANKRKLIEDLVDNHARHVWLRQEAAYLLGLAVGVRLMDDHGKVH